MRTIRLYADVSLSAGADATLPDTPAQHAVRVLRLRAGDAVSLFNGDGHEYPARIAVATARAVRVEVLACDSPRRESPLRVTLLQALARGDKMDWIVQKATELGVARIVPVATARSEVKLDGERAGKRAGHWRAIAIAACEQCGRNTLPLIDAPRALPAFLADPAHDFGPHRWALCPDDGAASARDLQLDRDAEVTLAIGPEGGFSDTDLAALAAHGFRALALGPRVLRTETAGIVALAALQALYGDF